MTGIAVLGSTGSIGASTLDVVARHPEPFPGGYAGRALGSRPPACPVPHSSPARRDTRGCRRPRRSSTAALRAAGLDTRVCERPCGAGRCGARARGRRRDGGDRRCRGTAVDARGRGRRPARAARQQGIPGRWRGAAGGGRARGGRNADPDRQRAQCDLPVPARRLDDRHAGSRRAPDPADRVGRPLPAAIARADGPGHARRGLRPPALAHGTEDLRRLSDSDEQGTGADRGLRAVRDGTTAGRSGRTSAEHRAFDGGVRGRIGPGSARQSGHAHTDRARPGLAGSHRVRCRIARPGEGCADSNSRRRTSSAFRR